MTYTCAILKVAPSTYADIKARIMAVNQNGDYDGLFHRTDEGQGIDLTHIMVVAEKSDTPVASPAEGLKNILHAMEARGHSAVTLKLEDLRLLIEGDETTIFHVDYS